MRKSTYTAFGATADFWGVSYCPCLHPCSPFYWQFRPLRWLRCRDVHFLPKYLRVGFAGASIATLQRRMRYRGGRKAKRAERRLRAWTRGAYFSDAFSVIVMGGALAVIGWMGLRAAA